MVEREWREASDMRPSRLGLAVVLAVAAALRFWNLGHGIPHAIGAEEPEIVHRAFHMMQVGTLNPAYFDHGQLPIYVQLVVSIVRFLVGASSGEWFGLNQATIHPFYLWGRGSVALLGTLTVLIVYFLGMRWGARAALLAAGVMAVLPLHVEYSQLVVVDVPFTFLLAVMLLATLVAIDRRTAPAFAAAGIAGGLAAGMEYFAVALIVIPVAASALVPRVRPDARVAALATVGGAVLGFVLAAPYTILDLPGFLNRFAEVASAALQADHTGHPRTFFYLRELAAQFTWPGAGMLPLLLALPALLVVGGGLVLGLVRAAREPGQPRWAVAIAFVILYLLLISATHPTQARHLLPVMPMVAVLASVAVIAAIGALRGLPLRRSLRTGLAVLLSAALIAPPAAASIRFAREGAKQTTKDLAYQWIRKNLTPDTFVIVEASAMTLPRAVVTGRGVPELRTQTLDDYAREGADYLLASSEAYGRYLQEPQKHRDAYLAYTRLFSEAREVARFSPGGGTRGPELRVLKVQSAR